MLQSTTFDFLTLLKEHNNKPWFEQNKHMYLAAKEDVQALISVFLQVWSEKYPQYAHIGVKDCMFRMHRDIRFSTNKSPFKTNFGFVINKEGKKSQKAGYYIHIEPGACFLAAGIYMPVPNLLKRIRQEIDYQLVEWKNIVESNQFIADTGGIQIFEQLTRVPKGFEKDNPAEKYLRLKHFITEKKVHDSYFCSKQSIPNLVHFMESAQPLLRFLDTAIADIE